MTDSSHILVVDDDQRVRSMLCRYLEQEGFQVTAAEGGAAMRRHLSSNPVDLILLDLVMPGEDGLSSSRELRSASDVPIIMLTGKGEPIDRVIGLEVGADDYIAKPLHLREVLARVRSVLRRSTSRRSGGFETEGSGKGERIRFAGWQLDLMTRELRSPDNVITPLTTGEFNLLCAFTKRPNRPLDRDQLMDLSRGRDWSPYDRSIDTQVGRLRRKLEADPKDPQLIKTVRGVGYLFTPKVERLD